MKYVDKLEAFHGIIYRIKSVSRQNDIVHKCFWSGVASKFISQLSQIQSLIYIFDMCEWMSVLGSYKYDWARWTEFNWKLCAKSFPHVNETEWKKKTSTIERHRVRVVWCEQMCCMSICALKIWNNDHLSSKLSLEAS